MLPPRPPRLSPGRVQKLDKEGLAGVFTPVPCLSGYPQQVPECLSKLRYVVQGEEGGFRRHIFNGVVVIPTPECCNFPLVIKYPFAHCLERLERLKNQKKTHNPLAKGQLFLSCEIYISEIFLT